MLTLPSSVRIFLAVQPTDIRKGHDGLAALVRQLGQEAFRGHLYVFFSRKKDRVIIFTWERGGFAYRYKRLEKGCFRLPEVLPDNGSVARDWGQLSLLLEGVDFERVKRPKRWEPVDCSKKGIDISAQM